jgi:hypothetical protein
MKKLLAVLLSACLAFPSGNGFTVPVKAAETAVNAEESEAVRNGSLEIEVRSSLSTPCGSVSVTIHNDGTNDSVVTKTQTLDFTSSTTGLARFDVPSGSYTVTIAADKFATYEQTVTVEAGWLHKILVCSSRLSTDNSVQSGWLRAGDVNGDHVIDDSDKETLLSVIHEDSDSSASWLISSESSEKTGTTDNDEAAAPDHSKLTDLNNDGTTDLADLQSLIQSLDENQTSSIEKLNIPQKVEQTDGTTIQSGSIEKLLTYDNENSVALSPADTASPVSAQNAVGLSFTLASDTASSEDIPQLQGITIKTPSVEDENGNSVSEISDGNIDVVYLDEEGKELTKSFPLSSGEASSGAAVRKKSAAVKARAASAVTMDSDGSLILNFGEQLAVKKVTIKITGTTKKEDSLVNIARVEFVNNMEDRIPAPQLDIPTLASPVIGDKEVSVSWNAQNNVTGYELSISGPVKGSSADETQIISVADTSCTIKAINDKELQNFKTYTFKVRSVNGDWKSSWSAEATALLVPQAKPDKPDNVSVTGGYRSLSVSWKDMEDADGYMVYYKKSEEEQYQPVVKGFEETADGTGKLEKNSYTITGLEDTTSYSVYVKSFNALGWGEASIVSLGTTKSNQPPQLPSYKVLNTSNGEGKLTSHIVNATIGGSNASMVNSSLDTAANSGLGLVDDDYGSYWTKEDWDDGVWYDGGLSKGMIITLDDDYKINYFTFAAADEKLGVNLVKINYWNSKTGSTASSQQTVSARLIQKTDNNNNPYYIVKLDETITADRIQMCLARDWSDWTEMKVAEIRFYQYDSLEDDIMNLYTDEMHTTLREDVTEKTIEDLENSLETPDKESGELHPLYSELKLELKTAKEILEETLSPSYEVITDITAKKDGHLGFTGLNAWQPLGKTAYEGETLLVYVGHNTKRTGDSTDLQLVVTQYHAESSTLFKTFNLKVGRNEITIPNITSSAFEHGGQIYIAYTGNNSSDQYAVRVSGGTDIPVLNLYGKTGTERTNAIRTYIKELEAYADADTLAANHEKIHSGTKTANYDYDPTCCILNATDIMMESMMYSIPASQVLAGIGSASDKVTKLDNALKAMEQTMTLFYQHKGLSNDAGTEHGNNALPSEHLNIRYMRMFAGAFMYAAGNHIGIEWGSTTIASGVNSWSGFGWGIAHEIGHDINQGTYAIAEITNNYFAQLLTKETTGTRFDYEKVYKKVTSGTVGRSSDKATQLALYWQLHLMFDDKDDKTIFDNYEDQFNNLFFARVDTYSRNPSKAPQSGLKLGSDVDQNLMRLACAAANKNILPFFIRWGMTPDEETTAYAEKYGEADTKALYYVNDDARDYRAAHTGETNTIKNSDVVSASAVAFSNQANITISTTADEDLILGYEITRSITTNGKTQTQVVGFQTIDTKDATVFTDTISSMNNRVISYEVRAVDKFLNYSNSVSAGSVKIQTDGILAKELWTAETTMTSKDDTVIKPDTDDPDNGSDETEKTVHSIDRIFDMNTTDDGTYHGIRSTTVGSITIDMHQTEKITSLKYQGSALDSVTVEVSEDGDNWTTVKENYTITEEAAEKTATIWFDSVEDVSRETWIGTYDARYVKLTLPQSDTAVSIKEIDLCAPSGDNLEFLNTDDGQLAVGVLENDYQYDTSSSDYIIPKGSLVFTGTYKGNPAYNVVVLYDTEGNVIGAKDDNVNAEQVIFADVPENGNLGETSDGTWIYYVLPDQWNSKTLASIKGIRGELYRVDNATTLAGERIVSDTQILTLPEELPNITLTDKK